MALSMLINSRNKRVTMMHVIRFSFFYIFTFVIYLYCATHHSSVGRDECAPLGTACMDYGLTHFYSLFHFNGRYKGDDRMRVPFSIAINAPVPGMI